MPDPDLGEVLSAATRYGDAREAATRAELAARIDTLILERDDALRVHAEHMAAVHPVEPPPDPDPDPDPPTPGGIRDLVRVRVFPHYTGKNYGQHDRVLGLLADLGCGVSGLLTPSMPQTVVDFYRRAYETTGVKTWFAVGKAGARLTPAQWDNIVATLAGPLDGMVDLASGWNEPNHSRSGGGGTNWAPEVAAHQAELYAHVAPLGIKVGTPPLWAGNFGTHDRDLAVVAPLLAGNFDVATYHMYPRGAVGADLVERFVATYKRHFGDVQLFCTEAGYSTGGTGGNPVTEAQQADLWPQHIRLYTDRGYGMSVFELLDDPSGGREGFLGIVRADWTPKPAFDAIRDLLAS